MLTGGHCIIGPADYIQVVAGRSFLNETGEIRDVKTITIHPDFDMKTLHNDIAIIEVARPFVPSLKINTISLIQKRVKPLKKCTAIGFGAPYYVSL